MLNFINTAEIYNPFFVMVVSVLFTVLVVLILKHQNRIKDKILINMIELPLLISFLVGALISLISFSILSATLYSYFSEPSLTKLKEVSEVKSYYESLLSNDSKVELRPNVEEIVAKNLKIFFEYTISGNRLTDFECDKILSDFDNYRLRNFSYEYEVYKSKELKASE